MNNDNNITELYIPQESRIITTNMLYNEKKYVPIVIIYTFIIKEKKNFIMEKYSHKINRTIMGIKKITCGACY